MESATAAVVRACLAAVVFASAIAVQAGAARAGVREIIGPHGSGARHPFVSPQAAAVDAAGNFFVAGGDANVFRVWRGGGVTRLFDPAAASCACQTVHDLVTDARGDLVVACAGALVAECILRVTPAGTVTELAGSGSGVVGPARLAVDGGGHVFVALELNSTVLRIDAAGTITRLADSRGDGHEHPLRGPRALAVDGSGNLFVAGIESDTVLRIAPGGRVDGLVGPGEGGSLLDQPVALALGPGGDLFVAGFGTANVLRIRPDGRVTQIIGPGGDGRPLSGPAALAVDRDGNCFVAGSGSNNVFRITPAGAISQPIAAGGDGRGHVLVAPTALATDAGGNVFVTGGDRAGFPAGSHVFRLSPTGGITHVIGPDGDGAGNTLLPPKLMRVTPAGEVFVAGRESDNAFRVTPAGAVTQVLGPAGDGRGVPLDGPIALATDTGGSVYVAGEASDNVFRVTPGGTVVAVVRRTGDGLGHGLDDPVALASDDLGGMFVAGARSHNVLHVAPTGAIAEILGRDGDGAGTALYGPRWFAARLGAAYVTSANAGVGSPRDTVFRVFHHGAFTRLIDPMVADPPLQGAGPIVLDPLEQAIVAGLYTDNVLRIGRDRRIVELLGPAGTGGHPLDDPVALAVDDTGAVVVAGRTSDNVFRIDAGGAVVRLVGPEGVGGHPLDEPVALAIDAARNVFVAGARSHNVFRVSPTGEVHEIVGPGGDGAGGRLEEPGALALDRSGNLFVAGTRSDNVLRVTPGGAVVEVIGPAGDDRGRPLDRPVALLADASDAVYVAGESSDNVFRIDGCGNGVVGAGEACDDGGERDGDGCSHACAVEPCFRCSGSPSACAPDDTGTCDDGNVCNGDDRCVEGVCQPGGPHHCPACRECFTEELGCVPDPRCHEPSSLRGQLVLRDDLIARERLFLFTWKGAATLVGELGDPFGNDAYVVCIGRRGAAGTLDAPLFCAIAPAAARCGDVPCWQRTARGFVWSDPKRLTGSGLTRLDLRAGQAGDAQVVAEGAIPLSGQPALADLGFPLVARVENVRGAAWEAVFPRDGIVKQTATLVSMRNE